MTDDDTDPVGSIHEQLKRSAPDTATLPGRSTPTFDDIEAEAAFWRAQFETERERLAKLWVAYKDLEAELEMRTEAAQAIGQRKVAASFAEEDDTPPESQQTRAESEGERSPGEDEPSGEPPIDDVEADEADTPERDG